MHMSDALLSPVVGGIMGTVSAVAISYAVKRIRKDELEEKKVPIMGVMGAFLFAAQMINFTIPITGSSGHIGGGILMAAILGQYPGFLAITSVLIIQALFFADGGLLALGCNIFNMGIIPCFLIYPLIFRPLIKNGITRKNLTIASIASVVIGLALGSFSVVLETVASGVTSLPFSTFLALMLPIHLAIGAVEGVITAAILNFVYSARPEILESSYSGGKLGTISLKKPIIILVVATVFTGGVLSLFASSSPDGLEWSIAKVMHNEELANTGKVHNEAAQIQKSTAVMPGYDYKDATGKGTSTAGLLGGTLTFVLAGTTGLVITMMKRRSRKKLSSM